MPSYLIHLQPHGATLIRDVFFVFVFDQTTLDPPFPPVWVFHGNPHFIIGKCIYNRRNEFYAWAHSKNIGRLANKKCKFPLQFRPFFPQDSGPSGYFWSCRYDIGTLPPSPPGLVKDFFVDFLHPSLMYSACVSSHFYKENLGLTASP